MDTKDHWEQVYSKGATDALSWFQLHAAQSMTLIEACGLPKDAAVVDIGGGDSMLVDDLLAHGHRGVSVLDLSAAALASARQRLGAMADCRHMDRGRHHERDVAIPGL